MKNILTTLLHTIFWFSIIFIGAALFSLTIGQGLTYEFVNWNLSRKYYDTIIPMVLVAILLTLTGTIKRTNDSAKNMSVIALTFLIVVMSYLVLSNMVLTIKSQTIIDSTILYRSKSDTTITISKQLIGNCCSVSDEHRVVKLEPILKFWNKVTEMDTTSIIKTEWEVIDAKLKLANK